MTRGQALAAVVLIHLAISIAHGRAHAGAQVPLTLAAALFVYIIVIAGPIAGLIVSRWRPRAGGWIVSATMAGALVFGLVNHFIIDGPDHLAQVVTEWRTLFGVTAALLVGCEAAGVAVGVWAARSGRGPTSKSDSGVGIQSRDLKSGIQSRGKNSGTGRQGRPGPGNV